MKIKILWIVVTVALIAVSCDNGEDVDGDRPGCRVVKPEEQSNGHPGGVFLRVGHCDAAGFQRMDGRHASREGGLTEDRGQKTEDSQTSNGVVAYGSMGERFHWVAPW